MVSLKTGGQFAAIKWGHFAVVEGGQFHAVRWGLFRRDFHRKFNQKLRLIQATENEVLDIFYDRQLLLRLFLRLVYAQTEFQIEWDK